MGTPPLATAPLYDEDPNTPRRWYRRPWVVVAVMVVVSLVIAAVSWWGLRSDDEPAPTPPPPAVSTPPASNGEQGYFADTTDRFGQQIRVPRDPAGLALPQVSPKATRGLSDAASGIQWQQIYGRGVAVFTTSDGPTAIGADGLAQGISRTPQGSAIAASQVLGRVFYGPPQVREKVIAEQIIGPPSAIAMLTDLQLPTRQYPADSFVRRSVLQRDHHDDGVGCRPVEVAHPGRRFQ
ncbi:hypothetical protein [Kitasatospora arboriphila]|uniref:hypothetical protein n=1 Tax=Kitasatospora arboriphila TaxID=258052 RepID=UPI00068FE97A|nr:hypothetical protein [Kitasatospora arboriphila]